MRTPTSMLYLDSSIRFALFPCPRGIYPGTTPSRRWCCSFPKWRSLRFSYHAELVRCSRAGSRNFANEITRTNVTPSLGKRKHGISAEKLLAISNVFAVFSITIGEGALLFIKVFLWVNLTPIVPLHVCELSLFPRYILILLLLHSAFAFPEHYRLEYLLWKI